MVGTTATGTAATIDGVIATEAANPCGSGGASGGASGVADITCRGSNCSSPRRLGGLTRRDDRRVIVSPSGRCSHRWLPVVWPWR